MLRARLFRVFSLILFSSLMIVGGLRVNAAPVQQSDIPAGMQLVGTPDGQISMVIPESWTFQSVAANEVYATTLVIAENEAVLNEAVAYQTVGSTRGTASGAWGVLTQLEPSFWQPYAANAQQAALLILELALANSPIYDQSTTSIGLGGYNATIVATEVAEANSAGYIGAFAHDGDVYFIQLMAMPADNPTDYSELVETIGSTFSIPAQPGARTDPSAPQPTSAAPTEEVVVTEEAVATEESTAAPSQVDAENGVLSVVLPDQWYYWDRTVEDNLFVYGNTEEAIDARLYAFRPDLFESQPPVTGLGGVIALYTAADVGVSATDPDVAPLMTQVLDNLGQQGYEIVDEPAPFAVDGRDGLAAVIHGDEFGFLALVPFDDQVAYITGTGTTDMAEDELEGLFEIMASVRVPAAAPEPTATPRPGLGGLGNLEQTPEVTPTPRAGLGGLGGLAGAATEEADVNIEEEATEAAS